MLILPSDIAYKTISIRPLDKAIDRSFVKEIFRKEFYGQSKVDYPDESLWEIYDRMDTHDIFGAYLVSFPNQIPFLLEIHPGIVMDIRGELLQQPSTIGIYVFFHTVQLNETRTVLEACIKAILAYPGVERIITTSAHPSPSTDFKVSLLSQLGFRMISESTMRQSIFICTQDSFAHRVGKFPPIQLIDR